jgi:hypothetical protein
MGRGKSWFWPVLAWVILRFLNMEKIYVRIIVENLFFDLKKRY